MLFEIKEIYCDHRSPNYKECFEGFKKDSIIYFRAWLVAVNKAGLEETRKRPGWHVEPLLGNRKGQRSIRLNKQLRAIYIIKSNGTIEFVEVMEVMPHEY